MSKISFFNLQETLIIVWCNIKSNTWDWWRTLESEELDLLIEDLIMSFTKGLVDLWHNQWSSLIFPSDTRAWAPPPGLILMEVIEMPSNKSVVIFNSKMRVTEWDTQRYSSESLRLFLRLKRCFRYFPFFSSLVIFIFLICI